MAAILIVWTAATFRGPLPRPLPSNLGINYSGLSSIAVMPISRVSSSVFRRAAGCSCARQPLHASWQHAMLRKAVLCMRGAGVQPSTYTPGPWAECMWGVQGPATCVLVPCAAVRPSGSAAGPARAMQSCASGRSGELHRHAVVPSSPESEFWASFIIFLLMSRGCLAARGSSALFS